MFLACKQGRIQDLLWKGAPTLKWGRRPNIFYTFSEKPHEMKEFLVHWGGAPGAPPLRSATGKYNLTLFIIVFEKCSRNIRKDGVSPQIATNYCSKNHE